MSKKARVLELGNDAKVLHILKDMAGPTDLNWYDVSVRQTAQRWFVVAFQHLRVARLLSSRPRDWRGSVSRSYYAAYNVSRCVRYLVNGVVKFDADDHRIVGDLPRDFPSRASWSTFLIDLRKEQEYRRLRALGRSEVVTLPLAHAIPRSE